MEKVRFFVPEFTLFPGGLHRIVGAGHAEDDSRVPRPPPAGPALVFRRGRLCRRIPLVHGRLPPKSRAAGRIHPADATCTGPGCADQYDGSTAGLRLASLLPAATWPSWRKPATSRNQALPGVGTEYTPKGSVQVGIFASGNQ